MPTLDDAIRKLEQGRLREGQRILEQLLEDNPSDPRVLFNLGMCYSERGMVEESIETLERCISLAPSYGDAYAALGLSYAWNNQAEKAVKVLQRGLDVDPDNFYILKNLGAVHGKLGQFDEAIEAFEAADEIQPDTPEILYGMATTYEQQEEFQKADEVYKRLIAQEGARQFAELARDARTRISVRTMKAKAPRYDTTMYCLAALEQFSQMEFGEVQQVALEIAMLGRSGLDIHNPDQKHQLQSLPGEYSGMQLLSYMYVAFQMLDPTVDVGADLSAEYEEAVSMFEERSGAH